MGKRGIPTNGRSAAQQAWIACGYATGEKFFPSKWDTLLGELKMQPWQAIEEIRQGTPAGAKLSCFAAQYGARRYVPENVLEELDLSRYVEASMSQRNQVWHRVPQRNRILGGVK